MPENRRNGQLESLDLMVLLLEVVVAGCASWQAAWSAAIRNVVE
jgi:hypothetical protein